MDVTDIRVGEDFVDAIGQAIASCQVVIVMIGPQWSTITDEMGRRRLDDPHDFVHLEVKSALERNILVVPVLVHGAKMPNAEELPVDLRPLARRNAIEIRHRRFEQDVEYLAAELRRYLGEDPHASEDEDGHIPSPQKRIPALAWLLVAFVLIVGGVFGYLWWRNGLGGPEGVPQADINATATVLAFTDEVDTETPTVTLQTPTVTPSPSSTSPPPTITFTPTASPTPTETPTPTPYPTQWADPFGVEMVLIPEGAFQVGTDHREPWDLLARPARVVSIDTFYIDKYEVSNAQYAHCVLQGGCETPSLYGSKLRHTYYDDPQYADFPVVYVSWFDAQAYCSWRGGRLPAEVEWEKAARGDDGHPYPWGLDQPDCQRANFWPTGACEGDTIAVQSHSAGASPYGVYNLSGNVAEWVRDWFQAYPGGDPRASKEFGQDYRVIRGGAYFDGPNNIRATVRKGLSPKTSQSYVGFRCVVDIQTLP
jgi:formylglycine-generating enzyme required for sulfatase activity